MTSQKNKFTGKHPVRTTKSHRYPTNFCSQWSHKIQTTFYTLLVWQFTLQTASVDSIAPQGLYTGVPGSQVKTSRGAELLHGRLSCFNKNGKWEKIEVPRRLPWVRDTYGRPSRCEMEERQPIGLEGLEADMASVTGEGWNVDPELLWQYSMDHCPWEDKVSYFRFCRSMSSAYGKKASILIIGDDFSYGFERRLLYNMLAAGPSFAPFGVNLFPGGCPTWDHWREKGLCTGHRICHEVLGGDSVAVRFVRSHNLSLTSEAVGDKSLPWTAAMTNFDPTVVVLNHGDTSLSTATFQKNVGAAVAWTRENFPEVLIFYRSTPTVWDCDMKAPPNTSGEEIKEQNKLAKEIVDHFGGLFLDINPSQDSRPPALLTVSQSQHCIHICQPGLMDTWIQLFYNSLMVSLPPLDTESSSLSSTITTVTVVKDATFLTTEVTSTAVTKWKSRKMGGSNALLAPQARKTEKNLGMENYVVGIDKYMRKPPLDPLSLTSLIPGSQRITTASHLLDLRTKLHCFTNKGKWVYDPTPRPKAWEIAPLEGMSPCDWRHLAAGGISGADADRVAAQGGNWSVREEIKWEWETNEEELCPLETFSKEKFCRALGPGRSVLLLGDSITFAFAKHLFAHIFREMNYEEHPPVDLFPERMFEWDVGLRKDVCIGYAVCQDLYSKAVEIRFCFNEKLSLTEIPLEGEAPWVTKLSEWKPSVLLLNRGAHYVPDDEFESELRDSLQYMRSVLPDALVIWRNTPPGHKDCMNYTEPLTSRQPKEILPESFHWASFPPQNEIARRLLEEIGGVYMDVDHLTSLRADGHCGVNRVGKSDCLHYCQPGPQDSWVKLLQNYVQALL